MSNWTFIEHISEQLDRQRLGDPRHPTLWPSEASAVIETDGITQVVGKCRRAIYFRYLISNYEFYSKYQLYAPLYEEIQKKLIKPDRYLQWIWIQGDLYEQYCINLAKISGVYIADQVSIYIPHYNVSGKIDLVVINPETQKLSNVEIKSVYGFNANEVLGTPGARAKGQLGTPRDSNLMQIALYDWWTKQSRDNYEDSRLVYGSRDTGRYAEYSIRTAMNEETGEIEIFYKGVSPNQVQEVKSPITLTSVFEQYAYIQQCIDGGTIPDRDYDLKYSDEKIQQLYENNKLNKTDKARYEKYLKYKSGESKRKIKPLVKGDWQCARCPYIKVCYKQIHKDHSDYAVENEL